MSGGAIVMLIFVLAIFGTTGGFLAYSIKAGKSDDINEDVDE